MLEGVSRSYESSCTHWDFSYHSFSVWSPPIQHPNVSVPRFHHVVLKAWIDWSIDDLAARTPTHFRCLYRWASIDCSFSKLPIVIFCSSCGISVLFLTPTETMKARDEGFCNIVCMKTLFFVFNFIFWVSESLAKSFQTNPNFCFERTVKVLFKRAG